MIFVYQVEVMRVMKGFAVLFFSSPWKDKLLFFPKRY